MTLAQKFTENLDRNDIDFREIHHDFNGEHQVEHSTDFGVVIFNVTTYSYMEIEGEWCEPLSIDFVEAYDFNDEEIEEETLKAIKEELESILL